MIQHFDMIPNHWVIQATINPQPTGSVCSEPITLVPSKQKYFALLFKDYLDLRFIVQLYSKVIWYHASYLLINLGKQGLCSQLSGLHFERLSIKCQVQAYREMLDQLSLLLCRNFPVKMARLPRSISKGTKSAYLQSIWWQNSSAGTRLVTLERWQSLPLWLPGRPQRQPLVLVAGWSGIQKPSRVSGYPQRQVESWWMFTLPPIWGGFRIAIDCITSGSLIPSSWQIYQVPGVQVISSKILLCSCKECPILLMACLLGATSLPSLKALGSKKKLTLSEDQRKYLLRRCYEEPEVASKIVVVSALGWNSSTSLSISWMAASQVWGEMKSLTMAQPWSWRWLVAYLILCSNALCMKFLNLCQFIQQGAYQRVICEERGQGWVGF